jgi:hypothetical protein
MQKVKNEGHKSPTTVYLNDSLWDELRIRAIKEKSNASLITEKLIGGYLNGKIKLKLGSSK